MPKGRGAKGGVQFVFNGEQEPEKKKQSQERRYMNEPPGLKQTGEKIGDNPDSDLYAQMQDLE